MQYPTVDPQKVHTNNLNLFRTTTKTGCIGAQHSELILKLSQKLRPQTHQQELTPAHTPEQQTPKHQKNQ